jgi:hypothetical protein
MDEFWDGNKNKYKFKFRSKTLTDLSIKDGKFTALVVYGKAERDKFIASRDHFSAYICSYFDTNKDYRDGKWMFIDITNMEQANDVIQMLTIKRKLIGYCLNWTRLMWKPLLCASYALSGNPTIQTIPIDCIVYKWPSIAMEICL